MKNFEPTTEKKNGERAKRAILVPEASPMWFGNDFEAANREEKYLCRNMSDTRQCSIGNGVSPKHCSKSYEEEKEREAIKRAI